MSEISLCMIVKNEEEVLERCLRSIHGLVDEIIIVDTGSTDKTKSIAKQFTNKIYDYSWNNDFSNARNYAFSLATKKYVMWLDADDVVPKSTLNQLKKIKPTMSADVYMLKYAIAFSNNKPTFYYYRERIIKNCTQAIWQGAVHECIVPFGKIEKLNLRVDHKKINKAQSNRNLKIYENLKKLKTLNPREQYYYGRELFDHKKYKQCIKILTKFINDKNAWTENIIDACYIISKCYKNLNNINEHLKYLFKTFSYDYPRANICCEIGDYFFNLKNYSIAVHWYNEAINSKKHKSEFGFINDIYYNYYPFLQLCCCHFYLNNIETAIIYNKKAGQYFYTEAIKNNEKLFKKLQK